MKLQPLIILVFFITNLSFTQTTTVDKIAAVVDKEIITESDIQFSIQQLVMQNKIDPKTPGLRERVLDGLIDEKLVLAKAIEDSVVVSNEEVSDRLERQINGLIQQLGSAEKLEELYKMPISRMKRDYQFKEMIRKQMLVQKIQQTRQMSLSVSSREVEEFFTQYKDSIPNIPTEYKLSHIYIQPKPDTLTEQKTYNKALSVLDSIKSGGDFADFARRYSTDPGSSSQGGDLGWVKRGLFVKEFEEAVFSMKEKEYSKPIKTQYGYHIIQLLERRGESVHPRHILFSIATSQADDDSAIALLKKLRERSLAGESFAVLAKKYSEDPETKDIGGDLGTVTAEQLEGTFLTTVRSLKEGEISEPQKITTGNKYGYHIILVRSIIPEHSVDLQKDYQRLEQLALQFKSTTQYQRWLEDLRKSMYWEKKE